MDCGAATLGFCRNRGDSLKFEIKTVEIADNAVQTRIFIDGVDVTNRIKKFTLKKDGSPLELSLTILGDIDVSSELIIAQNEEELQQSEIFSHYMAIQPL